MRNTIRAFLKKMLLDREKQNKAAQDAAKKTTTPTSLHIGASGASESLPGADKDKSAPGGAVSASASLQADIPQPSIEVNTCDVLNRMYLLSPL